MNKESVWTSVICRCSLSQSSLELDKNTGSVSVGTTRSLPSTYRRHSGTQVQRSDSELSAAACDLIQEYMDKVWLSLIRSVHFVV